MTIAVARRSMKPNLSLRPPSPAIDALMPTRLVPGSPIQNAAATGAL